MPTRYYINGSDGAGFEDSTIHTDAECAAAAGDGHARPLATETVETLADREMCSECTDTDAERDIAGQIDMGVCPWCDEYEGEYLGQHASSAHPDEWDAYKAR